MSGMQCIVLQLCQCTQDKHFHKDGQSLDRENSSPPENLLLPVRMFFPIGCNVLCCNFANAYETNTPIKMESLSLMCTSHGSQCGHGISHNPPADSIIGAAIATWKTHVCQVVNAPSRIYYTFDFKALFRSLYYYYKVVRRPPSRWKPQLGASQSIDEECIISYGPCNIMSKREGIKLLQYTWKSNGYMISCW